MGASIEQLLPELQHEVQAACSEAQACKAAAAAIASMAAALSKDDPNTAQIVVQAATAAAATAAKQVALVTQAITAGCCQPAAAAGPQGIVDHALSRVTQTGVCDQQNSDCPVRPYVQSYYCSSSHWQSSAASARY